MIKEFWSKMMDQLKKHKVVPWFVGIVLLLFVSLIVILTRGGTMGVQAPPTDSGPTDSLRVILDVIVKFGVVLFLIYVIYQIINKFRKQTTGEKSNQLTVLESVKLSPQQSLHMVKAHNHIILIGATDHTLTKLSDLDLPLEMVQMYQKTEETQDFSVVLGQMIQSRFGKRDKE
jgi:flagellar biogenesis protein FliO